MNQNQKVDLILSEYCKRVSIPYGEAYGLVIKFPDDIKKQIDFNNDCELITKIMEDLELIRSHEGDPVQYETTGFGRDVCNQGGWLAYLKKKEKDRQKIKRASQWEFVFKIVTGFTAMAMVVLTLWNINLNQNLNESKLKTDTLRANITRLDSLNNSTINNIELLRSSLDSILLK